MIPFIGDYYLSDQHKKMLLVGESFYFPKASTIHKNATQWYNSTQNDLHDVFEDGEIVKEIDWINCDGLLRCDWKSKGHTIYKNLNASIGNAFSSYTLRPMDEIAYTNFFVRPALKGLSISKYKKKERITDIGKANNVLESVLNVLNPDITLFVSKYAYKNVDLNIINQYKNMFVNFVCHPASAWWYRSDCIHNREYFAYVLNEKFINKL